MSFGYVRKVSLVSSSRPFRPQAIYNIKNKKKSLEPIEQTMLDSRQTLVTLYTLVTAIVIAKTVDVVKQSFGFRQQIWKVGYWVMGGFLSGRFE